MVAAVRNGRISEKRIDGAVRRLLTSKARLDLQQVRLVDESSLADRVGTVAHWKLAQEVADRSLTMLKNDGVLPLARASIPKLVNISVQKLDNDPAPATLAQRLAVTFPGSKSFTLTARMDSAAYAEVWNATRDAELVVLSLFVARDRLGDATPIREKDLAFLQRVIAAKPRAVVAMTYGNPHHLRSSLPCLPT